MGATRKLSRSLKNGFNDDFDRTFFVPLFFNRHVIDLTEACTEELKKNQEFMFYKDGIWSVREKESR